MKRIRNKRATRLAARKRGSITIEAALMLPVLMLLLYGLAEVGLYLLAQNRLHRATAALADVIINAPATRPERESLRLAQLPSQLADSRLAQAKVSQDRDSWRAALLAMLQLPGAQASDVEVEVLYHSTVTNRAKQPLREGRACPDSGPNSGNNATALHAAMLRQGQIRTRANAARNRYVVVRACYRYASQGLLAALILPEVLESHFLAVRGHWDT